MKVSKRQFLLIPKHSINKKSYQSWLVDYVADGPFRTDRENYADQSFHPPSNNRPTSDSCFWYLQIQDWLLDLKLTKIRVERMTNHRWIFCLSISPFKRNSVNHSKFMNNQKQWGCKKKLAQKFFQLNFITSKRMYPVSSITNQHCSCSNVSWRMTKSQWKSCSILNP